MYKKYYLDKLDEKKNQLHELAIESSHLLNQFYLSPESWESEQKADESLITTADHACHDLICKKLHIMDFGIPILSEENSEEEMIAFHEAVPRAYWLIDPLDGTSGFVKGTGHFAVNISLIVDTQAIAGWIAWPRVGMVCWAFGDQVFASGSFSFPVSQPESLEHLSAQRQRVRGPIVFSSSSQSKRKKEVVSALTPLLADSHVESLGAAVKFCAMFRGLGDLYPRLAGTCLWDLAAGQVLLKAVGGNIFRLDGSELTYDYGQGVLNPHFLATTSSQMVELDDILRTLNRVNQRLSS